MVCPSIAGMLWRMVLEVNAGGQSGHPVLLHPDCLRLRGWHTPDHTNASPQLAPEMNLRVNWIRMAKIPRCKHDGFLMENLGRWDEGAIGGEKHGLCESRTHQVDLQSTVIPTLERWPAKIHVVDLDSLRAYVLCQACQK